MQYLEDIGEKIRALDKDGQCYKDRYMQGEETWCLELPNRGIIRYGTQSQILAFVEALLVEDGWYKTSGR